MKRSTLAFITLLVGIAIGVAGVLLAPRYLEPYMPSIIKSKGQDIEGRVTAKEKEHDKLLVTVLTEQGAVLVTFTKKVPEINLLVNEGDRVTLSLPGYKPFVQDPSIVRVRKGEKAEKETPQALEQPALKERPAGETPSAGEQAKPAKQPDEKKQGEPGEGTKPAKEPATGSF
ncbi:MAG: hypothetical protein P8Y66_09285 [Nitrospirota bacterium]